MAGWIAVGILGALFCVFMYFAIRGRRRGYKLDRVEAAEFRFNSPPPRSEEGTRN